MSIGTGTDLGGTGLGGLGVGGSGPGDEPGTAPLPPPIDAPIRGRRIRLPRSPKIIAGLVMLAVFLIVADHRPPRGPVQPVGQLVHHQRRAATAVRRALARHHPDPAGRVLPAAGGRPEHDPGRVPGRAGGHRAVGGGRGLRRVPARPVGGRAPVHAGQLLPGHARAAAAHRDLRLPVALGRHQRRADRPDHRDHRLGVGSPGAAGPDPLAAIPRLRGLGPHHRRARLAGDLARDPAQPAAHRGVLVPVHRALRGGHLHRARLPGADQPRALELGLDAVRGAELRRRDQRLLVVVHPARAGGGLPRHLAGAAQLRHRRVHQPAAARGRPDPAPVQEVRRAGAPPALRAGPHPRGPPQPASGAIEHGHRQHGGRQPGPPTGPRSRRHDRAATAGDPRPAGGLRGRPRRRARGRGRRPDAAPRRGARAGRRERQRQVHAGLRGDPAAAGARDDHRRRGALPPRGGPGRGPARPGRAGTAPAALVPDRRRDAVRDERAEPGAVHRRPAHRRAAGPRGGHGRGGPPRPRRRTARHGRHHLRPARQLPARAVRRDAAARHDRDGPGAGTPGGDPGRADHRTGRGDPAGDPRGADRAARAAGLRGPVHHARPVAAGRDRGLDRGDVRGPPGRAGGRGRALPRPPPPVHAGAAELVPGAARPAPVHDRHPRLSAGPAHAAGGLRVPPALPVRDGHLPRAVPAAGATRGPGRPDIRPPGFLLAAGRQPAGARGTGPA